MEYIRKYSLAITLALVVLFLAGGYFFWWPRYNEYKTNGKILEYKGLETENKRNYLEEIEAKINILSDYQEEIIKINSAIPIYDFSEVALFSFIQKTCSENGLVLLNLGLADQQSVQDINRQVSGKKVWEITSLPFDISVAGSYSSLKNFLSAVYKNSRIIEVEAVSFSAEEPEVDEKGRKKEPKDMYEFDLELAANYYIEKTEPVSPAAPEELPL